MKILIAGGSGQLAKEFILEFEKRNINFLAPNEKEFDVTNKKNIETVVSSYKPDIILNCSAYTDVENSSLNKNLSYLINRDAVAYLAEQAKITNAKFIHFSTDYVFDGKKQCPYIETDKTNPLNDYGQSKLEGETEALKYNNSLIFRLSWLIGNGKQNFLYKLSGWTKKFKTINVSCDEISVPTFAFDVVKYVLMATDKNLTGLYHLPNSGSASRYELALEFIKNMKIPVEIKPVPMSSFPTKAVRPLYSVMSNKKISEQLNVNIPDWKTSLKYFVSNMAHSV
ncbi:dTDP-4-dehydrorhamnose reductase [Candidatus Ruminimicrobium bovinum]|uniref:dTDP-4-dehydrorhamnose reductase n=1 Tax=Candidatus Ruminimicrobium bovinum TaxID=3242779 RepID=UPI0039B8D221